METLEKKIARITRTLSLINWARQNFPRLDRTQKSLQEIADSPISVSLNPVYKLCANIAYREITYEEAYDKGLRYKKFHRDAATQILPVFNEYLTKNQIEAIPEFKEFQAPFPIGRSPDGKTSYIPVRPTFVAIREGRLRPVFLLGWIDSPLTVHQRRLISAIIRRSILTQQDFLGSDAEIVTFIRKKFSKVRQLGGWLISQFEDYSDEELSQQFDRYNKALNLVIASLKGAA